MSDIGKGTSTFLVKDESLFKGWDAEFLEYLYSEGFKSWKTKGYFNGIDWIYINLNSKTFAFGIPGIPVVEAIGNHAITINEFKIIYNIYKKYIDLKLDPLEFKNNRRNKCIKK